MSKIRMGVIGVGCIGTAHAGAIYQGLVPDMELCALCDIDKKRQEELRKEFPSVPVFERYLELIESDLVDAIIIATPHYYHPIIAESAFERHIHVLSEKPIGVYTFSLKGAFLTYKNTNLQYAVMLNQRANKLFKIAKELIDGGKIGELKSNHYEVTNWYRTQEYYDSGAWRGTWQGEGGGVLMNQAPHNLDIWQYLCGMPKSVKATCFEGKYHNIEVEDEAIIEAEYENGAVGTFITSTGIENGKNRFEIVGDKGSILLEGGKLILTTPEGVFEYLDEEYNGHLEVLLNFADAILNGTKLIAPASEAVNQLIICNASYMSSWTGKKIDLPMDEEEYLRLLSKKTKSSCTKKECKKNSLFDKTYQKKWTTNW